MYWYSGNASRAVAPGQSFVVRADGIGKAFRGTEDTGAGPAAAIVVM